MKRRLLFMFLALSVIACKNKDRGKAIEIKLFKGFVTNSIPNTGYSISLPAGYKVIEERGPDFSVYGIRHKDSTVKSGFGASIYLGNFPSKFSMPDSCKASVVKSLILKNSAQWEIYDCKATFFTQTLIDNKHNHQWDQKIHAWGSSTSKAGIDTVLYVFSTLNAKE